MAEYSSGLVKSAENLQGKCEDLLPQLAQVRLRSENFAHALRRRVTTAFPGVVPALMQIDVLEAQVGELESAVEQLDSYSKRLEMKFSALQNLRLKRTAVASCGLPVQSSSWRALAGGRFFSGFCKTSWRADVVRARADDDLVWHFLGALGRADGDRARLCASRGGVSERAKKRNRIFHL